MKTLLRTVLRGKEFKKVLREWALFLEQKKPDAATFANMFLEMMRDPKHDDIRRACCLFANYMKPRRWARIMAECGPFLEPAVRKTFRQRKAAAFFESYKALVIGRIQDYWTDWFEARQDQTAIRSALWDAMRGAVSHTLRRFIQNRAPLVTARGKKRGDAVKKEAEIVLERAMIALKAVESVRI